MRVIGRLLLVLAIALPATWIVAVGVASGDSGFGPAVLYCNHWDDDMRLSPGATQNPTNQSVSAHGKLFGCNKAGGGATFNGTLSMGSATCSSLSMSGSATFDWTNGSHSAAFLNFQQQSLEPNKVVVNGTITSGAYQGLIIRSELRFTQVYQGSGPNCSPQNPLRSSPLLLMTDQEGGLVRRLPGAPVLSEKQIGESAGPAAQATAAGTGAGQNLAGAGLNVNLAPVLDVYRTAGNFDDQFQRSYSMNPQTVADLGADFITAQQATEVAATAKHFPGLGTATSDQNTDQRPVTLTVPLTALRTIDEYPYQAAIAAGVKLVLVSWAIYPALDPVRPAGLSPTIVGGELRQRLGFTGVTITDALEAGALQPFGTIGQRATLAAQAGMDLILCSAQQASEGDQAKIALENGYQDGTLGQAAFQAALHRVLALKSSLAK